MAEKLVRILIIIAVAAVFISGCIGDQDGLKDKTDAVSDGTDNQPGQIQNAGVDPSGTISPPVQTGQNKETAPGAIKDPVKKPGISAPTASVVAANNPDTPEEDVKIMHKGGDTLKGGDWKLSIVPLGASPTFITSAQGSDFGIADIIIASTATEGATGLSDSFLTGSGQLLTSGAKYDIKLIHIPTNSMLLDQIVEVR